MSKYDSAMHHARQQVREGFIVGNMSSPLGDNELRLLLRSFRGERVSDVQKRFDEVTNGDESNRSGYGDGLKPLQLTTGGTAVMEVIRESFLQGAKSLGEALNHLAGSVLNRLPFLRKSQQPLTPISQN